MSCSKTILRAIAVLCLLGLGLSASAQPVTQFPQWDVRLADINTEISDEDGDIASLDAAAASLQELQSEVNAEIAKRREALGQIEARLERLPAAPDDGSEAPSGIAEDRARISREVNERKAEIAQIRDLEFRITTAIDSAVALKRQLFTEQLLERGPGIFEQGLWLRGVEAIRRKNNQIMQETAGMVDQQTMVSGRTARLIVGAIVLIGTLVFLYRLRRWAISWLTKRLNRPGEMRHRASIAVSVTLTRLLLPSASLSLLLIWTRNSGLLGPLGEALLDGFGFTMLAVIGSYGLSSAFFAPNEPRLRISRYEDGPACTAHLRIVFLALIVGIDNALVVTGEDAMGLPVEALVLINSAVLVAGGIALWRVASALRPALPPVAEPGEDAPPIALLPRFLFVLRFVVQLAAIAAPVLALVGYYYASRFTFFPLVFSSAVVGIGVLVFYMVRDAVEEFVLDHPADQNETRKGQGIRLIPVLLVFVLSCVAIPIMALIWGASTTDLVAWWRIVADGFSIGDVNLSPVDVLSFLMLFCIGYALTRMLQGVLNRNVLPLTSMDTGARDAISAGVGYVGVIMSALIAISATGLDLSNLAIVAGALSVGIGFGLQNIVNNFVSGIILLIERPIKAGDWVELASGMGYVKKVNVRSTEVQTFDRSTLFVPNSELISSPVINWTHTDMHGRIIVKVGVAYGTEPRKVEGILQEIADAHNMLLNRPAPYILFRGFGSDSLDFEIRGVLRDVNWILNVQSDINYEISRRFAEEGIEIPFAQREVTIKNLSEMGEGIARVTREAEILPLPQRRARRAAGQDDGASGDGDGE